MLPVSSGRSKRTARLMREEEKEKESMVVDCGDVARLQAIEDGGLSLALSPACSIEYQEPNVVCVPCPTASLGPVGLQLQNGTGQREHLHVQDVLRKILHQAEDASFKGC